MAVAIVTKKQGVQLAHIQQQVPVTSVFTMPKEMNRLVIDGLSDILFTAGISNNSIANKEGAGLLRSIWWVMYSLITSGSCSSV